MTRTRILFAILAPALIAGGFVANNARADRDGDQAQAEADARAAAAREAHKQIEAARQEAQQQLDNARQQVENAPLPDDVKAKILKHLDKIGKSVKKHLDRAAKDDVDQIGDDMDQMGDDLGSEMDALGEEMGQMGDQMGQMGEEMGKKWEAWAQQKYGNGGWSGGTDDFDSDSVPPVPPVPPVPDVPDVPDVPPVPPVPRSGVTSPTPPTPPSAPSAPSLPGDVDLGDIDIDIDINLGDLQLGADQLDQLHQIFDDEKQIVGPARGALSDASDALRDALQDPNVSADDIAKMVDAVSAQEAKIRKAEILAWVESRQLLSTSQRDQVENAQLKVKHKRRTH